MSAIKKAACAAVSLGMAALLSACGGGGSDANASGKNLETVSFLTNYISTNEYTALVYGQSQGYFTDAGINLELNYGSGSSTTAAAIGAGKADIGDVAASVLPISVGQGIPIKGVGSLQGENAYGFVVPKSSGITSIDQLSGKSVLVSTGTTQVTLLPAVLKAAGMDASAINQVVVSPAARVSSYKQGQGDATAEVLPSEMPVIGDSRPSIELPWAKYVAMPNDVFVANNSYLESHASTVQNFLTAYYRSLAAAYQNPDAANAAYASSQPMQSKAENAEAFDQFKQFICSDAQVAAKQPVGYPNDSDWKSLLDFAKKYEDVPASVTLDDIVTDQFFTGANPVSSTSCQTFAG